MEITPIAVILLPLGVFSFFFAPRLLYWCTVFFLPFSATAVVNFNLTSGATGLQATMFFGVLWMLKEGSGALREPSLWQPQHMQTSVRRLRFFMFAAVLSLIMPIYINGRLTVDCRDVGCTDSGPLIFNFRYITQVLYLTYGVMLTVFIAVKNSDIRQFRKSVRIFLTSAVLVSLWGFLQWYCYRVGVSYPAFIFNNNTSISAQGYLEDLRDLGLTRISSVATEPSILAHYTIIALVFAIFAIVSERAVISRFWDRAALVATALVLLMSTSTTAYAGLAILLPVSLLGLWYLRRLGIVPVAIAASVVLVLYLAYSRSDIVQVIADEMIFSKSEDYSGIGRINSLLLGFTYFRMYPILGIGWGSFTPADIILKLLSNTGILGLFAFGWFLKSLFSQLWGSMSRPAPRTRVSEQTYWACCLFVATFMLIAISELSGFAFVYGHTWFVFGMALAVPLLHEANLKARTKPQLNMGSLPRESFGGLTQPGTPITDAGAIP
jgi:hypothetical protein